MGKEKGYVGMHNPLENIPLGYICVNNNGIITDMNQPWLDISGYKRDEVTGYSFCDFIHKSKVDKFPVDFNCYIQMGTFSSEYILICKGGNEINVMVDGKASYNSQGIFDKFHCIVKDITDKIKVEAAFENSLVSAKEIISNAGEGIVVIDKDYHVVEWNLLMEKRSGIIKADATGKNVFELLPMLRNIKNDLNIDKVFKGEKVRLQDFCYESPEDNKMAWMSTILSPQYNSEGKIIGLIAIIRDITAQKKAEDALRDREYWLKESQRVASIGSYIYNIEKDQWSASDILNEIFGIPPEAEKTLNSWNNIIHPDHQEEMLDYFTNEVFGKITSFNKEYKINRVNDKEERWVLGRGELVLNKDGVPIIMHGTIQDITERKQVEDELKKSEEKFSKIFYLSPDAISITELSSGKLIDVNEGMLKLTGYTREELIGSSTLPDGLGLWEYKEDRDMIIQDLNTRSEIFSYDVQFRTKDKKPITCLLSAKIIEVNGNKYILSVTRDITEKKKMEKELERLLAFNNDIISNAGEGIVVLDKELNVVEWNATVERWSGLTKKSVIGKSILGIFPNLNKEKYLHLVKLTLEGNKTIFPEENYKVLSHYKTGWVTITCSPHKDKEGNIIGVIGIVKDINLLKKVEESLKTERTYFKELFENSPVATWIEDLSLMKEWMVELRTKGVADIKEYLNIHPDELQKILSTIKIIDVNQAAVFQNKATDKNELIENFLNIFNEKTLYDFTLEIESFWKEQNSFEYISHSYRLDGEPIISIVHYDIPTHNRELDYSRVIVTSTNITELIKTEEALMLSETRYRELNHLFRLMSDNMQDMLWAKDLEKRFIYVNKPICEKLLKANDTNEPIGKTEMFFTERERKLHPDKPDWHTFGEICSVSDNFILENAKAESFIESGNVKGQNIYLDVHKAPILDEAGKMIGIVGSARDITTQRATDETLKEEQDKIKAIYNALPDLFFVYDNDGKFLDVHSNNPSELLAPKEQIMGSHFSDFFDRKLSDTVMNVIHNCIQSGTFHTLEYDIETDSGKLFYEARFVPIGKEKVLCISRNITERVLFERSIKENEERFRALYDNAPLSYQSLDKDGHILDVNPKWLSTLGYNRVEVIGQWFGNFIHISYLDLFKKSFRLLKQRGYIHDAQYMICRKDGSTLVVTLEGSAAYTHEGKFVRTYDVFKDITEHQQMEQIVLNAMIDSEEKQRAIFSADLHDGLGILLSSITLYLKSLEYCKDQVEKNNTVHKIEDVLNEATTTLKELSNNLSPHILKNHGLESALKDFCGKLYSPGISIYFDSNLNERVDQNYEVGLYRIIVELTNNTMKHANAKDIHIILHKKGNELIVEYSDNGYGFEVSQVLKNTKGSGLYNVINRVKAMNGLYNIDSSQNKGFKFSIVLKLF